MTDEEIIAVVTAHKEGKKIEYREFNDTWCCIDKPHWDFNHVEYRVKPEPHYRPFKNAEEVMEAIEEHGDWLDSSDGYKIHISKFNSTLIWIGAGIHGMTFYDALDNYHFEKDGTPFGKLEE